MTTNDQPTSKEEMEELLRKKSKGGFVDDIGNGLAFVDPSNKPIQTGPSSLLHEHGWYVGGYFPNWDEQEIGVFVFPDD